MLTDGKSWFYVEGIFSLRARFGDLRGTEVLVRDDNFYVDIRPRAVTNEPERALLCHFCGCGHPLGRHGHHQLPYVSSSLAKHSIHRLSIHEIEPYWVSCYDHINGFRSCHLVFWSVDPTHAYHATSETMRAQGTEDLMCICSVHWSMRHGSSGSSKQFTLFYNHPFPHVLSSTPCFDAGVQGHRIRFVGLVWPLFLSSI